MINESRVRLMTGLAVYESREGNLDERIGNHFRGDYIGGQMLTTFVFATVAYLLGTFAVCFYHFEKLMLAIYSMDLTQVVVRFVVSYLLFLLAFLLITYFVYSYRYNRARTRLEWYYRELHRLSGTYRKEEY